MFINIGFSRILLAAMLGLNIFKPFYWGPKVSRGRFNTFSLLLFSPGNSLWLRVRSVGTGIELDVCPKMILSVYAPLCSVYTEFTLLHEFTFNLVDMRTLIHSTLQGFGSHNKILHGGSRLYAKENVTI